MSEIITQKAGIPGNASAAQACDCGGEWRGTDVDCSVPSTATLPTPRRSLPHLHVFDVEGLGNLVMFFAKWGHIFGVVYFCQGESLGMMSLFGWLIAHFNRTFFAVLPGQDFFNF